MLHKFPCIQSLKESVKALLVLEKNGSLNKIDINCIHTYITICTVYECSRTIQSGLPSVYVESTQSYLTNVAWHYLSDFISALSDSFHQRLNQNLDKIACLIDIDFIYKYFDHYS